jgi:hypothetical protein
VSYFSLAINGPALFSKVILKKPLKSRAINGPALFSKVILKKPLKSCRQRKAPVQAFYLMYISRNNTA